jgi:hypothetical protein
MEPGPVALEEGGEQAPASAAGEWIPALAAGLVPAVLLERNCRGRLFG